MHRRFCSHYSLHLVHAIVLTDTSGFASTISLCNVVSRIEQATRLSFLPSRLVALSGTPITACKWTQSQGWLWCAPLQTGPAASVSPGRGELLWTHHKAEEIICRGAPPLTYLVPSFLNIFTSLTNQRQTLTFLGY